MTTHHTRTVNHPEATTGEKRDVLWLYVYPPRDERDALNPALFACGMCGHTHGTEEDAKACYCRPKPCKDCGQTVTRQFHLLCNACDARRHRERQAERDRKRMETAKTLTYAEWLATRAEDEMLTDGEEFYLDWESYDIDCSGEHGTHLWATTFQKLSLTEDDVYDWVSGAAEEHHEGIMDHLDTQALGQLVEGWCAQQEAGSWYEDPTRKVLGPLLCNGFCPECSTDLMPDGPNTRHSEEWEQRVYYCRECDHEEPGAPPLDEDAA